MNHVSGARIDRRSFVAKLLAAVPDALIITGLGSPTYDVYAAEPQRQGVFYLWGAMGGAVPTGLGLALAQSNKPVVVVTGDGEQLMGIGALGTVAVKAPANLTVVVLDNGHFGETGMQQSHSSLGADLTAIAAGFGIGNVLRITEEDAVEDLSKHINSKSGTLFAQVLIAPGEAPRVLPTRDGVAVKNSFRSHLGMDPL